MNEMTQEYDDPKSENLILEMDGVNVSYDMERGVSRVLDNVSISVRRNEIIGVVGESGSGKSMFASSIMDAVPEPGITTGEIVFSPNDGRRPINVLELNDKELDKYRWEDVSMVFQGAMSSFNPTLSIRGHFEETIREHEKNVQKHMSYARDLLTDLHLDPSRVMSSYPHELSGGMQQRVLIALSLVLDPDLLIMDEPTGALDLLMQRSIIGLLSDLKNKYDITIIFITHDLPLVAGLCDRLAVMYAFQFIEQGPATEIINDAAHPYTRALLQAVPSLEMSIEDLNPIEGESPDSVNVPSGCAYHPRCSISRPDCEQTNPKYHSVDSEHEVACFHWEQSADAVEYSFGEDGDESSDAITTEDTDRNRKLSDPMVKMEDIEVYFNQPSLLDSLLGRPEEPIKAVDGVSLDVYENDVVALVGESGCGKTTFGKTGIVAQRPTAGTVSYRGQDAWAARDSTGQIDIPYRHIRKSLQMIHQDPESSLNSNRTVKSNLEVPLKRHRKDMSYGRRKKTIYKVLEEVGMSPGSDYAERFPHQLSGGEAQRVALSRVLLMQPDLVLADEAVSALDVSLRVEMMDLLLQLQDLVDTSYLFISHDLANARYMTEKSDGRIGIMYLGKLVEIGSADQVLHDPKHPYTQVLMWATPSMDPNKATKAGDEEPPVRSIDVPTPEDPPEGCNFNTRCVHIVPPNDIDISQELYNQIVDVRFAIQNRAYNLEWIFNEIREEENGNSNISREDLQEEFVEYLRIREFDLELPNPHRQLIDDAFAAVAMGEWDDAAAMLQNKYESICERKEPTLETDSDEYHPAACHHYSAEGEKKPELQIRSSDAVSSND